MKKVFFCTMGKFPRGDATANYVEYLALGCRDLGYEVNIISKGKHEKCLNYKDMKIFNVAYRTGTAYAVLDYLKFGRNTRKKLKENAIDKDDIVFLYSDNPIYLSCLWNLLKSIGCKTHAVVVEWFQPFQYKYGLFDVHYILANLGFKYSKKIGSVVAISTELEKYFKSQKCATTIIPILANTKEFDCEKIPHNKIEILISGGAEKKDDFQVMFRALDRLSEEQLDLIHVNITGMSKSLWTRMQEFCSPSLLNCIEYHPWLEYDELILLYKKMDFLLLARPINSVTKANFPSKVPEVMSYGIIPIVTDVGDYTRYYLDSESAIIFDGNSEEECFRAIKRAIEMKDFEREKMSWKSRKLVEEKFDYRNWIGTIEKLL